MIIAFWIVAGLNAALYLGGGAMKLLRPKSALLAAGMGWTEPLSSPTIKFIGLAEVLGAAGLILPIALGIAEPLSPIAGACLTVLMIGAVITHRRRGEPVTLQVALAAFAALAAALAAVMATQ